MKQVQGTEIDPDKLETTVDTNLNAAFDTALLGDIITVPINKHVYVSPAVTVTEDMKNKSYRPEQPAEEIPQQYSNLYIRK